MIALSAIALLAGLALSGVYSMTKDTIDDQHQKKAWAAYQAVVPQAVSFDAIPAAAENSGEVYGTGFGRTYINEAVEGKDASGNTAGYAVSVTCAEGYDGNITLSVGIDPEGRVNSIAFTELHETPGKGMLCEDPKFKDQFNGRAVSSFKL